MSAAATSLSSSLSGVTNKFFRNNNRENSSSTYHNNRTGISNDRTISISSHSSEIDVSRRHQTVSTSSTSPGNPLASATSTIPLLLKSLLLKLWDNLGTNNALGKISNIAGR